MGSIESRRSREASSIAMFTMIESAVIGRLIDNFSPGAITVHCLQALNFVPWVFLVTFRRRYSFVKFTAAWVRATQKGFGNEIMWGIEGLGMAVYFQSNVFGPSGGRFRWVSRLLNKLRYRVSVIVYTVVRLVRAEERSYVSFVDENYESIARFSEFNVYDIFCIATANWARDLLCQRLKDVSPISRFLAVAIIQRSWTTQFKLSSSCNFIRLYVVTEWSIL